MARPCLARRCPILVERGAPGGGYCAEHARARHRAKEEQPHRWVYRDIRWKRCRRQALVRAGYRCEVVENGERCPITDPTGRLLHGHHFPKVKRLLELGLNPFDPRHVRIACQSHHGRIEAELRKAEATEQGR